MSTKVNKEAPGLRGSSPSPSEDDNLSLASPKRGRKESEQRRRVMMNQYFDELVTLLSMLSERCIPKKMDKATTLHETVRCIQIYSDLTSKPERTLTLDVGKATKSSSKAAKPPSPVQQPELSSEGSVQGLHTIGELLHFFLDAHDAFLMVVSESGRVLYSTELITSLLGHMQTRLVGQNFFDFVHENDHKLFHDILKSEQQSGGEGVKLKDRPIIGYPPQLVQCHLRLYAGETGYFPQYLLFKSIAYLRKWDVERSKSPGEGIDAFPASPSSESGYSNDADNQTCLVMIGKLPTSLSMVDLPVGTNDVNFEFEMRVSREGRIIDINKHAGTVLGYTSSEIIGTSFFDYVNSYHLMEVSESMSTFLSSGLGTTMPYRLLTKGGRSIWLISKGYLSYNPWNNKPDHILLTNRVLGCDQVLPEHRFFRSRKLLPDLEGHECYVPNIPVSKPSPPPQATCAPTHQPVPVATTTANSAAITGHAPELEGQFDIVGDLSHQQQGPPLPHYPPNHMVQHHQHQVPLPHQGGSEQHGIQRTPQSTPTGPSATQPPGGIGTSGMSQPPQVPPSACTAGQGATVAAPPQMSTPQIQNFDDIQRELDRKNREIFEMQRKLFEQQQLFEKERNQFYSITAQVMQCISSSTLNIPSNMHMVMSTANEYNPPGMLNVTSKTDNMGHSIQPTAHGHFPSGSVQTTATPLWDNTTPGSSLDTFSAGAASQQYHIPQPHAHQAPSPHQVQQSLYPQATPTTTAVPPVSSVNFTVSDFINGGSSSSVTSASQLAQSQHSSSTPMLSEQFGLSQAFKMSSHHSLAEHNMQYYHHPPMPHQPQPPQAQRPVSAVQRSVPVPVPVSQSQAHLSSLASAYGGLLSDNILSNLSVSPSSGINLPSLPGGLHAPQKNQQSSMASNDLADLLNTARYT